MSFKNGEQQLRSYIDDTGCGPDTVYIRGVCCVSGKDSMNAANKMAMTHLPMYNTVIIWDNVFKKSKLSDAEDSGSNKTKSSRSHTSKGKASKRKGKKMPNQKFIESGEEHFKEDFADGSYDSIGEGSGAGIGEGTEPSSLGSFETGIEEYTTLTGKSSTKLSSLESMTGSYKDTDGKSPKSVKTVGIGEISCESNNLIVLKAMQELGGFASSKRLIDHICKATHVKPNVIFQLVNSTLDWTDNMGYVRCVGKYYSLNYDKMFKLNPELLNQLNRQENVAMLCRNVFGLNTKDKRKHGKRDCKTRPSWK